MVLSDTYPIRSHSSEYTIVERDARRLVKRSKFLAKVQIHYYVFLALNRYLQYLGILYPPQPPAAEFNPEKMLDANELLVVFDVEYHTRNQDIINPKRLKEANYEMVIR